MEIITIRIIDEIVVYLEVDIIISRDHVLDLDNSVQIGQIISSGIARPLEIIIRDANPITEMIIVGIVRIEVNRREPHSYRTDTTLCEEAMRIELPQRVVIEFRCQGVQHLFISTSRA